MLLAVASLFIALPAIGETVQSGDMVMDTSGLAPSPPSSQPVSWLLSELLFNPGFETGSLPPWTTNNWTVINTDSHSGTYCAFDVGNFWVRQDFPPVDTADIVSVSFWCKQPEEGTQLQAVYLHYSDNTHDSDVWFPPDDWTLHDLTGVLRPAGNMLVAIQIWGYAGGGPGPDETFVDDVSIEWNGAVPVSSATWGQIKSLF
jgi:hypothetical protein